MGFTDLEARIYVCLLQCSPATGYKVAKEIKATNAGIYKAIESLESKGAVIVDDARNRLCRAVPFDELFEQMERRFKERRRQATEELCLLRSADEDDRIYQLKNVDQIYARCEAMLRSAEQIVVIDAFPKPFAALKKAIQEAAARIPKVLVQVYEPSLLEGVELFLHRKGEMVLKRWPVHWLGMTSDGRQSLLAAIDPLGEKVHQALWTASPVLSYALLSYTFTEFQCAALMQALEEEPSIEKVREKYKRWYEMLDLDDTPGYRMLMNRFGGEVRAGNER